MNKSSIIKLIDFGTSSNNFKEITRLKNDHNYTFTLGGLNNGNAYYFYVVGEKAGFTPLYSDTIMVIPNQKLTFSTLASTKINQTISQKIFIYL